MAARSRRGHAPAAKPNARKPSPPGESSAPEAELSFETAAKELEAIVNRLEAGDLELEDSLAAFERGVRLARRCAAQLDAAEQRIDELVRESGKWTERPLSAEDPAADDGLDD